MTEILAILTLLFGGTNIVTLLMIRQEKRKAKAEASEKETDAKRKSYELVRDQADNLMENLDKVQREYMELQGQVRDQATKYTTEIIEKCRQIGELKSQVIYFKGIRCYKTDCSYRISKNPQDKYESKEKDV